MSKRESSMTEKPIIFTKSTKGTGGIQTDLVLSDTIEVEPVFVKRYREEAARWYKKLPLPSGKEEEWRRTSLQKIDFGGFRTSMDPKLDSMALPAELMTPVTGEKNGGQVFLTPGKGQVQLEESILQKGVIFGSLKELVLTNPKQVEKILARIDFSKSGKFGVLAGALGFNGILLYVPKGIHIDTPIQSLYWAPVEGGAHSHHVFVYLEEDSSATYVHEASSPAGYSGDSLHAGLMHIYVGPGAHLNFVELQSWGENVINFTREDVFVDRDGSIDWIFGALGSKLTKNFSTLNLIGEGSVGKMSGFYFTDNDQHLDHDTQQNHLAANTTSDLLFKGALLDHSRSVWQGMIYVAPNAVKTDGYQANRNLVLSRNARADSIPGLEILTDDVRCTHGATVGKIDEEQIFYLESRGLPTEIAERVIVEGFFDPIMQRIPFEGVRNRFKAAISEKMEHIG